MRPYPEPRIGKCSIRPPSMNREPEGARSIQPPRAANREERDSSSLTKPRIGRRANRPTSPNRGSEGALSVHPPRTAIQEARDPSTLPNRESGDARFVRPRRAANREVRDSSAPGRRGDARADRAAAPWMTKHATLQQYRGGRHGGTGRFRTETCGLSRSAGRQRVTGYAGRLLGHLSGFGARRPGRGRQRSSVDALPRAGCVEFPFARPAVHAGALKLDGRMDRFSFSGQRVSAEFTRRPPARGRIAAHRPLASSAGG